MDRDEARAPDQYTVMYEDQVIQHLAATSDREASDRLAQFSDDTGYSLEDLELLSPDGLFVHPTGDAWFERYTKPH